MSQPNMNYLFFQIQITPEQTEKLLSKLSIYKLEHLNAFPCTFKSYSVKKNNKKVFKDFYESVVAKTMKNIDAFLINYPQNNFLVWDQFGQIIRGQHEYVQLDKKAIVYETFGKDSVWLEFDTCFMELLQGDKYLPVEPDCVLDLDMKLYQWGDLILKVVYILKKDSHLGSLLTIYYQPTQLVEYKFFLKDVQKETERQQVLRPRLFQPVLRQLFKDILGPETIEEALVGFQSKCGQMLMLYMRHLREEKKSELVRFDVLENMMTVYNLKKLTV